MEPTRRRRPPLSCNECRRRKVKCDRQHPCRPCVNAGFQCSFKLHPRARNSAIPGNNPVANGIDGPESDRSLFLVSGHSPQIASDHNRPAPSDAIDPNLHALLQRIERLENASSTHASGHTHDILIGSEQQENTSSAHADLKKTRLLKWSDTIGELFGRAPEFSTIWSCFAGAKSATSEIGSLLRECKQLSRSIKLGRSSRTGLPPSSRPELPSQAVAEKMVNNYFNIFESTYRILHRPSFMSEWASLYPDLTTASQKSQLKIILPVIIGSSASEPGIDRSFVEHWIYVAETWLAGPLEKDRLDVTGIQIHCLTLLARQTHSIGSDLAWISSGTLLQKAMQVGLHRDPKHLPSMSSFTAEIRRRLWATILEMVLQDSLDSGMPPRITVQDFDTLSPAAIADGSPTNGDFNLVAVGRELLQSELFKSFPLRLQIVDTINDFNKSESSYDEVLTLTEALFRQYHALIALPGLSTAHRHLLSFHGLRFLIPLNATFAARSTSNPLYHYSYTVIIDTAVDLMSAVSDSQMGNVMTVAGGMFRESIRMASTLLSMKLLSSTKSDLAIGALDRNAIRRKVYKDTMQQMLDLTRKRVHQGETNIKNYMFLAMILAEVKALEDGGNAEAAVSNAARDSLRECAAILEARLGSTQFAHDVEMGRESTLNSPGWGLNWDLDTDLFFSDIDFYQANPNSGCSRFYC